MTKYITINTDGYTKLYEPNEDYDFKEIQKLVEGYFTNLRYIEIDTFDDKMKSIDNILKTDKRGITIYCCEDAIPRGMDINHYVKHHWGTNDERQTTFGTVLIKVSKKLSEKCSEDIEILKSSD